MRTGGSEATAASLVFSLPTMFSSTSRGLFALQVQDLVVSGRCSCHVMATQVCVPFLLFKLNELQCRYKSCNPIFKAYL